MSILEYKKGKLIPIEIIGDLETTCKKIFNEEMEGLYSTEKDKTYKQLLATFCYGDYYITDSKIFKIEILEDVNEDEFFIASSNEDGSIDYEVQFYNGGGSFDEALGEAIKNIKNPCEHSFIVSASPHMLCNLCGYREKIR